MVVIKIILSCLPFSAIAINKKERKSDSVIKSYDNTPNERKTFLSLYGHPATDGITYC